MTTCILDLHIHSKYSRACSKDLTLPTIADAALLRGINIVSTGDFTHPKWFAHIKEELIEDTSGVYRLRTPPAPPRRWNFARPASAVELRTRFVIGTEVASIKKHKGQTRRVHLLLFAPSIESAERLNRTLADRGFNISSDGRPILGLTSRDLLELMLEIDERMVMIPAHAWTPWFGIFGSKGGYDRLEDAFDDLAPHIRAIETGLSSDPAMNWQCSFLDDITCISNSDAHSAAKLGREANILAFENEAAITYAEIMRIVQSGDRKRFLKTIEFYPEEGKYHYDGHRDCGFSCHPKETKKYGGRCPQCKKPMVIGVLNRVLELADRTEAEARFFGEKHKIPFQCMVPLPEILGRVLQSGWNTKTVQSVYSALLKKLGSEFEILLHTPLLDIEAASSKEIAEAIDHVRRGKVHVVPGYDGEFGIVQVFGDNELPHKKQTALFS